MVLLTVIKATPEWSGHLMAGFKGSVRNWAVDCPLDLGHTVKPVMAEVKCQLHVSLFLFSFSR